MSKQIAIVQSPADEAAFIKWISKQADMLCLPRIMDEPKSEGYFLGECSSNEQVIFLKAFLPEVIGNIQQVYGKDSYHVFPQNGICFEWTRSSHKPNNSFVPGRFFYEGKNSGWPVSARELDKIFDRLRKWIITRSPQCTDTKFPVYVGMDLAEQVAANKATVLHRGGSKMELVNNVKFVI